MNKWGNEERMYFGVTMCLIAAVVVSWIGFAIMEDWQSSQISMYEEQVINMQSEIDDRDAYIAELEDRICGYCELLNEATDQLKEQYETFELCNQYLETVDKDRGRIK